MGYKVVASCDRCGDGWAWRDRTVSRSTAEEILRKEGWTVGKKGYFCPACAIKKPKGEQRNA